MRIMYDSVTPRNILNHTTTPTMVAGYANGRYKWSDADWALFPNAVKVRIAVRAYELNAHVLDCELGDATPAECPLWARERRARGGTPIIYCNRSTWPIVITAFDNSRTERPLFWIATGSGRAEYPSGTIGAQYLLDWQGVDVSAMADYIPGIDPDPITPVGEDMAIVGKAFSPTPDKSQDYVTIPCNGARKLYIATGANDTVDGIAYFIGDTPAGKGTNFVGDNIRVHVDPQRPGPFNVPANCRVITLGITKATHEFTAWCA